MPLKNFKIENEKTIRFAESKQVPPIMVIAGPNGVGKSTLLYCIRRHKGVEMTGSILYIPPHRAWRKQQIRAKSLWIEPKTYSEALMSEDLNNIISGIEGISILNRFRSPDSADEAANLVKFTLSQIETRRQTAITKSIDNNNLSYPQGKVLDIYLPLKNLTRILLPHLEFSRIDVTHRDSVQCLWKRASSLDVMRDDIIEIDIDDLSSGGKSIISLFLPFIERQIDSELKKLEGKSDYENLVKDLVVLIDEPELHLHPALQSRVLDYLRQISSQGEVQFIITTHSSTLLNAATENELYLLMPQTDSLKPSNQLIQLSNHAERLEAVRLICGDTYPVTACKTILCLEGELPEDLPKKPPDKRILENLCPKLRDMVLIPMGGKSKVLEGTRRLKEIIPKDIPGISVFALTDRDQTSSDDEKNDWQFELPVCMLENLLLVPSVIEEFLKPYRERVELKNEHDIETALRTIAQSLKDDEIRLRVKRKIKPIHKHISGTTVEEIKDHHTQSIDELTRCLPSDEEIAKILSDSTQEVEEIIRNGEELKYFRGKEILDKFYNRYINHAISLSFYTFCMELSRQTPSNKLATEQLEIVVSHIQLFVPKELIVQLNTLKTSINISELAPEKKTTICKEIDLNLELCNKAICERDDMKPIEMDRIVLRKQILKLARTIEEDIDLMPDHRGKIKEELIEIRLLAQRIGTNNKQLIEI